MAQSVLRAAILFFTFGIGHCLIDESFNFSSKISLVDRRADMCEESLRLTNGEILLKDVLRGKHLTFVTAIHDAAWFDENKNGEQSGFHSEVMKMLAQEAGFTYTIVAVPTKSFAGMSWNEYLDVSTDIFDICLDYWTQTPARVAKGLRSPCTKF